MTGKRIVSLFLLLITLMVASAANQTKALCYSGSTLYQQITQNCNEKDSSYVGEWYCAKIEVCEANISPQRQCIVTRGCATEQECINAGASAGSVYQNTELYVNNQKPAGMTMKATCCLAHNFPDDDTAAIDYADICNSAPSNKVQSFGILVALMAASVFLLYL